ncbi:MAG: hypothetical protein F6J96_34770 [Symploca sp. SIO1C2]|nr:hypothetical protein [Symploca sp. SIO1C2]
MDAEDFNAVTGELPDPLEVYSDPRAVKARERNRERIRRANEADNRILGKYLPSDISSFFSVRICAPNDDYKAPSSWLSGVLAVATEPTATPAAPQLSFDQGNAAEEQNSIQLQQADFDMTNLLESHRGTTVGHGSEFRSSDQLERVIGKHPAFGFLCDMFEKGFPFKVHRELSEEERETELTAILDRGNHSSAKENIDRVRELLAKEVKHGFSFVVPKDLVRRIKGALVQPCGIVSQFSLNADGSRKKKLRLTHDMTFSMAVPDGSVNKRIDMERYPEMVYGWCLIRIIHFIVALREANPGVRIYISKFDYSDAYRRISHQGRAAAQSILVVDDTAFVSLRMAFGGSANPPGFCAFSETLTDLANDLAASDYDPDSFPCPTVEEGHCAPREYPKDDEPFQEAMPTAFEIPLPRESIRDCFIDDLIQIFLDNIRRNKVECHVVPMAVHVLSRPHAGEKDEPVPRRPLLAPEKLLAEGRPSERATVLGWGLDTRLLIIFLPEDKFQAWIADLDQVINDGGHTTSGLESLVGRLTHSSYVIPLSRHFLNEIRRRVEPPFRRSKKLVRLSTEEIEDLRLWREFLQTARDGISLNLLTVRNPSALAWSDSCPFGLGGYTLNGRAWRILLDRESPIYGDDRANNILEFLGMAVSLLLLIKETTAEKWPCLLALGDNTSAVGWVFRTGKLPKTSIYYAAAKAIARKIAREAIAAGVQICSQHIQGEKNDVADALTFEGDARGKANELTFDHPSDEELTHRMHQSLPQLIPENFEISPLPPDITSFVSQTLQIIEESLARSKKPPGQGLREHGIRGGPSQNDSEYQNTSTESIEKQGSSSASASSSKPESSKWTSRTELLRSVRNRWLHRLLGVPSAMWARRSGQAVGEAPCTSATGEPIPRKRLYQD